MTKQISVLDFFKQFPDDDSCLEHLMSVRFGKEFQCPKCKKQSKFHRIKSRQVFGCQYCGHQISPMAGTPFEKSRTPLQKWFYAIYLFTTSRHGVPAKELQRQLSVTYKTAWRMGHEIRKYMGEVDGDDDLSGHVEIDEAYIGGESGKYWHAKKVCILGMVERGGNVITRVVPGNKNQDLLPVVAAKVDLGSTISTDGRRAYRYLPIMGYEHDWVNHHKDEYVRGDVYTNTIEGFWARLKLSIKGTHVHVSRKHLPKYLAEFEFRYNMRGEKATEMLDKLLLAF